MEWKASYLLQLFLSHEANSGRRWQVKMHTETILLRYQSAIPSPIRMETGDLNPSLALSL